MRIVYILTLLLLIGVSNLSAQRDSLYLIKDGIKFGYVNKKKKIVITPRFFAAYNFREGLAAVREAGLYGYINTRGHYVIPPRFTQALPFREGLARVYENHEIFYIDKTGRKASDNTKELEAVHTSKIVIERIPELVYYYMDSSGHLTRNEPHIAPYNKNIDYEADVRYFIQEGMSSEIRPDEWKNYPDAVSPSDTLFPKDTLGIVAVPEAKIVVDNRYNGYKVFVVNAGQKAATLVMTHGRLRIWLEALSEENEWRNVEIPPRGDHRFSSNFYRRISLPAQSYWELNSPVYEGVFKTKMRYAMYYFPRPDKIEPAVMVYSNEFEGSINPGQTGSGPIDEPWLQ
ncbi:WG repeat-containing protein [Chitinophaga pinensis]|uniref:WG repeat-containing protein n=1 Tax=Chitinophaga pinensis TaxID=79329 RepID=A0A5C6LNM1_9BACT|nr:WG repeat-containing protein [Chitinophaga pinensis]TWV97470.1 WG repeat-containing protein [Chitinophaga pinensis]